jgi:hypothetical protein
MNPAGGNSNNNNRQGSQDYSRSMKEIISVMISGKEIITVDFSRSGESRMIRLVNAARELIKKENRPRLILEIFNKGNPMTQKFFEHFEREKWESIGYVEKLAIVGLPDYQINLFRKYYIFSSQNIAIVDSRETGLKFLTGEVELQK